MRQSGLWMERLDVAKNTVRIHDRHRQACRHADHVTRDVNAEDDNRKALALKEQARALVQPVQCLRNEETRDLRRNDNAGRDHLAFCSSARRSLAAILTWLTRAARSTKATVAVWKWKPFVATSVGITMART